MSSQRTVSIWKTIPRVQCLWNGNGRSDTGSTGRTSQHRGRVECVIYGVKSNRWKSDAACAQRPFSDGVLSWTNGNHTVATIGFTAGAVFLGLAPRSATAAKAGKRDAAECTVMSLPNDKPRGVKTVTGFRPYNKYFNTRPLDSVYGTLPSAMAQWDYRRNRLTLAYCVFGVRLTIKLITTLTALSDPLLSRRLFPRRVVVKYYLTLWLCYCLITRTYTRFRLKFY